jgi:hypothetical protein
MGAPQTLPANFNGWDQPAANAPPATLPKDFGGWDDAGAPADTSLWGRIKAALKPRDAMAEPGARPVTKDTPLPGSTEGPGMLEGLSDYDKASGGEIGGGVHDIADGNVAKGLHRVLGGFMSAAAPAIALTGPASVAAAPVTTGLSVAGGIAGQKAAHAGAEALGATPDQADLAGDVAGLASGVGIAKGTSAFTRAVTSNSTTRAAVAAVPDAVSAALKKLPQSAIQRIPYLGDVLTDVYKAGSEAYSASKTPPIYPGASLPADPGTFPGANLPAKPPAEVLQANALNQAGKAPPPAPADALGKIPAVAAEPEAAEAAATSPTSKIPAKTVRQSKALGPDSQVRNQAEALRQPVQDIIDQAIPPVGATRADNLFTKAQVDFHLDRGDVAQAEAVLDSAASRVNPSWEPQRPQIVPAVKNIQDNAAMVNQAESLANARNPADAMDDRATQQEMNWNLENHGYRAASEAKREFIARNSTGATKGDLVQQAKGSQPEGDLSETWQKALDEIKNKKGQPAK